MEVKTINAATDYNTHKNRSRVIHLTKHYLLLINSRPVLNSLSRPTIFHVSMDCYKLSKSKLTKFLSRFSARSHSAQSITHKRPEQRETQSGPGRIAARSRGPHPRPPTPATRRGNKGSGWG